MENLRFYPEEEDNDHGLLNALLVLVTSMLVMRFLVLTGHVPQLMYYRALCRQRLVGHLPLS